jgi:DNA (cytosine-5)-methyltransferase 1
MKSNMKNRFSFIDLFCGIGGMRLGFEEAGCDCKFSCDWNAYARKTYAANFVDLRPIAEDIHDVEGADLGVYDILVGGFPCQPFSISGVSKKNSLGRPHGFEDKTQGTLFFEVARLIRDSRPAAFVLENVKNLLNHDKGRTMEVIYEALRDDLGYYVYPPLLLDAKFVVPQHRERVFIVGFREPRPFRIPMLVDCKPKLKDILEKKVDPKYTLSDKLWNYLQAYAEKHRMAGNGFGFGLADLSGISRTLSARYYKDGSEILIPQQRGRNPRRLTPRECARLMGFPESFAIPVSDTQAYKQFGNSVVVPLVAEVAKEVVSSLSNHKVLTATEREVFRQTRAMTPSSLVM